MSLSLSYPTTTTADLSPRPCTNMTSNFRGRSGSKTTCSPVGFTGWEVGLGLRSGGSDFCSFPSTPRFSQVFKTGETGVLSQDSSYIGGLPSPSFGGTVETFFVWVASCDAVEIGDGAGNFERDHGLCSSSRSRRCPEGLGWVSPLLCS